MLVGVTADPHVVAVVPTLGGGTERLTACLSALAASHYDGRLAVVVVWNDDRRPVPPLPDVTVLTPGLNLGFAGSLVHARSRFQAQYLWAMQDDVVAEPSCLAALVGRAEGAAAPPVVTPVALDDAGLVPAGSRGGVLRADHWIDTWFPAVDTPVAELDPAAPLDYVASSGMLVRLSVWDEVGGYDPSFFPVAWSDVDFCTRVRRAGHACVVEPRAHIRHPRNASTPSLLGPYLFEANQARFAAKQSGTTSAPRFDVDPALATQVGAIASLTLLDFARFASATHHRAVTAAAAAEAALAGGLVDRESMLADVIAQRAADDAARDRRIARLTRRLERSQAELAAIHSSRSWRALRRLRAARVRLRRLVKI